MIPILKALGDRLKVLLLSDAALDIEATLLSRQADRVATLLVEADQHDEHGCPAVAQQLRRQAEALSLQQPLASIRPAIDHLHAHAPEWDREIKSEPTPHPALTTTNGNGHARRRRTRSPSAPIGRTV